MTDISIDKSNLPGVKEVCRDFAVLEDHSLAHTLQEQEIEHHLATNIQRNRLAKHDLKVAKQLQEEEYLIAQVTDKHRHNELENIDSEIAQEIQEKLVIEAESRRRQEEKDEDIARLLQEREEKRRKKHYPPHGTEDPYYPDHGGHHRGRHKEHMSESDKRHRHERPERSLKEEGHTKSKQQFLYDDDQKRGRSAEPRSIRGENPDHHRPDNHNRTSAKKEKPERPPQPRTSRLQQYDDAESTGEHSRRMRSRSTDNAANIRPPHSPNLRSDRRAAEKEYGHEGQRGAEGEYEYERDKKRSVNGCKHESKRAEGDYNHKGHRRRFDSEYEHEGKEGENEHRGQRRRAENKSEHEIHRRRTPSPNNESHRRRTPSINDRHRRKTPSPINERKARDGGNRPKGHGDGPPGRLRTGGRNPGEDDAEIARRLQEEELRVNTVDYKTAQMAQDEEIARWLMEKEEKSLKKSKGREKERRRADEHELNAHEHVRSRSKDELHRSRNDKPYRPLPPPPDEDYNGDYSNDYTNRNSQSSPRSSSKSQSSHKGSQHRQ